MLRGNSRNFSEIHITASLILSFTVLAAGTSVRSRWLILKSTQTFDNARRTTEAGVALVCTLTQRRSLSEAAITHISNCKRQTVIAFNHKFVVDSFKSTETFRLVTEPHRPRRALAERT
eukprot:scaffold120852_cov31-Prasinocladus_malaysianus.AAC.1